MAEEYRKYHDLTCPARDVTAVPDELITERCKCPQDGRWLNPRARPVPEPEDMAAALQDAHRP